MRDVAGINGGRHVAPLFAGDTVFAWSAVVDRAPLPGRDDAGALRLRLVATKDRPCRDFPYKEADGSYEGSVVLDLDHWALMPRWISRPTSCTLSSGKVRSVEGLVSPDDSRVRRR